MDVMADRVVLDERSILYEQIERLKYQAQNAPVPMSTTIIELVHPTRILSPWLRMNGSLHKSRF